MKDKKQRTLHDSLQRIYVVLFILTIGIGVGNIVYLLYQPNITTYCIAQKNKALAVILD